MLTIKKKCLIDLKFIINYFILLFLLINAATAHAQMDISVLAEKVAPSVVLISIYDSGDELIGVGTGFFIGKEGLLVTNYHVVENGVKGLAKLFDGEIIPIETILSKDKEGDLVLLKVGIRGRSCPILKLTQTAIKAGQRIVVIGSPFGLINTISDGIISAIRDTPNLGKILQISAPISEGSSGSPVLDMKKVNVWSGDEFGPHFWRRE